MAKATEDTRAEFRVVEKSFLGHATHEEGASFFIDPETHPEDGEIGENLVPVNDAAQAMIDGQKGPHSAKGTKKPKAKPAVAETPAQTAEELTDADLG